MEATEFRIGNYVHAHGGNDMTFCKAYQPRFLAKIVQLSSAIWWESIEEMPKYYHNSFYPIKLTEDWLFKFGFEKDDEGNFAKIKNGVKLISNHYNETFEFCFDGSVIEVDYVHQLQNLFFALTGKELVLELIKK